MLEIHMLFLHTDGADGSKNSLLYIHLLEGRDQVGGLQDWDSAGDDGVVRDHFILW